jgi:hypothetical protein
MYDRWLHPLSRVGTLLLCASIIALAACAGKGSQEQAAAPPPQATPTLTAEQLAEMKAIPDLGCDKCPAKADVVSEEKLSGSEALKAIDANNEAADLYASAGKLGYHDVLQGQNTTYTDGTVVNSALIQGDDKGVAILATSTGSTSGTFLIRLDPANSDQLIVTDVQGGSATITWAGELIDSQETHNSCHYWHCVGAAVSWLYDSTWYADFLGAFCHQCAEEGDEITCGVCLASLPSGLLASTASCGIDSCDYCQDDSCGDDVIKSTQCRVDPSTIGSGLTPIYGIYQTTDDYSCQNPGGGSSQCVMASNVVSRIQVCPGDCAANGTSCAPAQPRTCDPAACGAHTEVTSTGPCYLRHVMRWTMWEAWWTGRLWSCQPDGAGGSVCVPGAEGSYYSICPYGCDAEGIACASTPPTPTPTRTATPTRTPTRTPTVTRTAGPSPTTAPTRKPTSPYQQR